MLSGVDYINEHDLHYKKLSIIEKVMVIAGSSSSIVNRVKKTNVNKKTIILDNTIRSVVEKELDTCEAINIISSIARQSKETGPRGEMMLLHIKK